MNNYRSIVKDINGPLVPITQALQGSAIEAARKFLAEKKIRP